MENLINLIEDLISAHQFIAPERFINAAFALLMALIIGFITGPRLNSAVPFFWRLINVSFGQLADRLDNINRKAPDLLFRSFIISLLMILFVGALGIWLEEITPILPQSRLIEIIVISLCISTGAVIHHGMRLYQVIHGAKMSNGTFLCLANTSRIDLSTRDDFTLTRTGAEVFVRLYDKACVAPLIWYVLGGLPLLFIYAALAALSWKNGYDGTYNNVGKMALMLEKLMGFVPNIFAASLLAMTTLIVPYSKPFSGLKSLSTSSKYDYDHGGAPLHTISETLDMTLGGDVSHLNGRKMSRGWSGSKGATAMLKPEHLKRVLYMVFIAQLYMLVALFGGSMWAEIEF